MFVGLGLESDCFNRKESTSKDYTLFVGNVNPGKKFRYFGTYSATRVDGLSVEEWKSLAEGTKRALVDTTHTKGRHIPPEELRAMSSYYKSLSNKPFRPDKCKYLQSDRRIDDIRNDYDTGVLKLPCVQLVYKEFNHDLYEGLEPSAIISPPTKKLSSTSHPMHPPKRRRGVE